MAFTKKHKGEMIAQYAEWINKSQAIYLISYGKMGMKEIDALRAKVRETGSEAHIVKNTLLGRALNEAGIHDVTLLEGTSLAAFAFSDAAALAKVMTEVTKNPDLFAVKGGFLGEKSVSPAQVKALAELPALPVMRAKLLGMINAPASQLVRTIAEPARSIASVLKAYSEKDATSVAA